MRGGFAESTGYWRMLWWSVLADVPSGMDDIDCPVVLAQGTRDLLSGGQTPRFRFLVRGSRFHPLLRAGHTSHSDSPDDIVRLVHEATRASRARVDQSDVESGEMTGPEHETAEPRACGWRCLCHDA